MGPVPPVPAAPVPPEPAAPVPPVPAAPVPPEPAAPVPAEPAAPVPAEPTAPAVPPLAPLPLAPDAPPLPEPPEPCGRSEQRFFVMSSQLLHSAHAQSIAVSSGSDSKRASQSATHALKSSACGAPHSASCPQSIKHSRPPGRFGAGSSSTQ